jgi:putative peptidoglycan lipid II flippase
MLSDFAVRADPQRGGDILARGDTATSVKAALIAAAVNIAFKVLVGPLAQVGLALATSIGAWINRPGRVVCSARRSRHA